MLTKLLSLLLLISSAHLTANTGPAREAMTKLFGQTKDKIKITGCEKFQLHAAELFKSIKYRTSFKPDCDLQGEVALKLFSPFPLKMNIKNLSSFKIVEGTARLNLGMENPAKILAELTRARLIGKETIFFNAFYSGEIMPASTLRVKPGTEKVRVEIFDKDFNKKREEFSLSIK